jgi:hypothetical protein
VEAVSVEAAALAGGDGGAVAPRGIGVAEPLALRAVLGDVPLAVRVGREVACVDGYVSSILERLRAQSGKDTGERRV